MTLAPSSRDRRRALVPQDHTGFALWVGCLVACGIAGCASGLRTNFVAGSRRLDEAATKSVQDADASSPEVQRVDKQPLTDPLSAISSATEVNAETALASVLDELQTIGALDPQAQQELMALLKEAKPQHYPLVVQQFQAALAYRQQLIQREAQQTAASTPQRFPSTADPGMTLATDTTTPTSTGSAATAGAASPPRTPSSADAHAPLGVQQLTSSSYVSAQHPQLDLRGLTPQPDSSRVSATTANRVSDADPGTSQGQFAVASTNVLRPQADRYANTEKPPARTPPTLEQASTTAAKGDTLQVPRAGSVSQVGYQMASHEAASGGSWRDQLRGTNRVLAQQLTTSPRSTEELHEHMRLRALQLLAGDDEQAFEPIPGAAPGPQDFWSKQLFAIATYLDDRGALDEKQRAVNTLTHLDAARGQLSELATLQLRNMNFVESVEGYGVYEVLKKNRFSPAQQVTVYAEVENFRSESTAKGFRTSLATSYQVLDEAGRRVDGGQFPEVEDLCHNRRRDFHMQYVIPLPERIYPGEYRLELIITDQLSNKIGQQSVSFEIIE
jgi:hypothetical protein